MSLKRNLLIITQSVDLSDPTLGFFHLWIEEFAKHCDAVHVVCLKEGTHHFPKHVHVYSLGKEEGTHKVVRTLRFFRYVLSLQNKYDRVFVHMNPLYVVLAGALWKLLGKEVSLWYVHKSVDVKLRIALLFCTHILTVSKRTFPLKNRKVIAVGHAILIREQLPRIPSNIFRVLSLGRVSPVKDLILSMNALSTLTKKEDKEISLEVVGEVPSNHVSYGKKVKECAKNMPYKVQFMGGVAHTLLPALFASHDLLLNTSHTGGMDKAVLEAMGAGMKVVTTNEAFEGVLDYPWFVKEQTPEAIAEAIEKAQGSDPSALKGVVEKDHALQGTIRNMTDIIFS